MSDNFRFWYLFPLAILLGACASLSVPPYQIGDEAHLTRAKENKCEVVNQLIEAIAEIGGVEASSLTLDPNVTELDYGGSELKRGYVGYLSKGNLQALPRAPVGRSAPSINPKSCLKVLRASGSVNFAPEDQFPYFSQGGSTALGSMLGVPSRSNVSSAEFERELSLGAVLSLDQIVVIPEYEVALMRVRYASRGQLPFHCLATFAFNTDDGTDWTPTIIDQGQPFGFC